MLGKPFRSPLLKKPDPVRDDAGDEPPLKKRRISGSDGPKQDLSGPRLIFKASGISSLPRKPFAAIQNPAAAAVEHCLDECVDNYYNVLWYVEYTRQVLTRSLRR